MDSTWALTLLCLGLPISCAIGYAIVAYVNVWSDERNEEHTRRIVDGDLTHPHP